MTAEKTLAESPSDPFDILAEMSRDFADSRDIDATLARGLERVARHMKAEAASLFVLDADAGLLTCRTCYGPVDVTGLEIPLGQGIVGRTVQENAAQMVRDVADDPDFQGEVDAMTGFRTRSILCAPLSVREETLGAVELMNKTSGDALFSVRDRRMLEALASAAALSFVNARLTKQLLDQERTRRELELASEIQRGLLPRPGGADFPVHGLNRAARTVSGDFFDIIERADGRLWFSVGDVSGKGMNAALLMAKTSSLFRCLVKSAESPAAVLDQVNRELCETASHGMFVTMVGGLYDPATDTVLLANAGHEPPVLLSADGDGRTHIPAAAPPLGILPDLGLAEDTTLPLRGGSLYVYTDGLTEARTAEDGMLGQEAAEALLRRHAALDPGARLEAVADAACPAGVALRDDVTLLVVDGARARSRAKGGLSLSLPARPESLKDLRAAVRDTARRLGCSASTAEEVVLAVDEACQNVIRHAYRDDTSGRMELEVTREDDRLVIRIRDFAPTVDPAKIKPRALDDLRPGGLGTHFIRSVMDDAAFEPPPEDGGNLFRMTRTIS